MLRKIVIQRKLYSQIFVPLTLEVGFLAASKTFVLHNYAAK